jgi:WD40 repeat protein
MPEINDEQLAGRLRDALAAEAGSVVITDAAARVARVARVAHARGHAEWRGSSHPWALAGIAASLVVALGAGIGLAVWHGQPGIGAGPAESGESATATSDASLAAPVAPSLNPSIAPTSVPVAGQFSGTGTSVMGSGWEPSSATRLADNRVLIIGGQQELNCDSAEIYDPKTGEFTRTGSLIQASQACAATLLQDGRVLVAGGLESDRSIPAPSELYDPATGKFSLTGETIDHHFSPNAILLQDGRVLLSGNSWVYVGGQNTFTAELYDSKTGTFSHTGSPLTWRANSTATLLADGRVLFAGGFDGGPQGPSKAFSSAEIYDPKTGLFTPTGSLISARMNHTATLLPDGRVLIEGGNDEVGSVSTAELYDPQTGRFSQTGSPLTPSDVSSAGILLGDGRVLIVDGYSASAELYDPATGTFGKTGSPARIHNHVVAALLSDGRVLILGTGTDTAELYQP